MAQIDTKDKVTVSPPKNEKSSISKIKRDLIHFHIDNNDLSTDRGINANQIVDDTNNKTIAEAIPNEITKNEETKRKHKDLVIKSCDFLFGLPVWFIFHFINRCNYLFYSWIYDRQSFSFGYVNKYI